MVKLLNYGQIWKVMSKNNLLHLQKDTSSFLKIELDRISKETGLISDVRGYGTHLGFDCDQADIVHRWFLKTGINLHRCGPKTFVLRPSLTLSPRDGVQLRESMKHFNPNFEK
jgi:4-aminobutyrate aminotransferase-like enzyme